MSNEETLCECPICNKRFASYLPFGMKKDTPPRPNAMCPVCKSLERHRLMWLFFHERTNLFTAPVRMLHIAPEPQFIPYLKACPNIRYLSGDLESTHAMVKMDLTDIHYPDRSFDVIYASHVLEHIPDDRRAMRELYRVLEKGGWAVLQVPVWGDKTLEDPTVTSPEEREKRFGQFDHVRLYGHDGVYEERLRNAGFSVHIEKFAKTKGPEGIRRYGLMDSEDIYYCTKG